VCSFPLAIPNAAEQYRRGVSSFTERDIPQALAYFEAAEALGADADQCAGDRWQCHMLLGQFEAAWQESDRITARRAEDPHALWDGKPFAGKHVIIRCLHGYGDAIQFVRYASRVRETAASVTIETHPEMVGVLSLLRGGHRVISWEDEAPFWDQQIEVTELPRAFRTTAADVPSEIPYLFISPDDRSRSRQYLPETGKPRIGLVWSASSFNPERSITLAHLSPLLDTDDYSFFSFQRGPARAELTESPYRGKILDTALHSPNIEDTAADLSNMDLLVTVDTMAAHLAGALAVPVFTLLHFQSDWRWMLDREDTPWYPTMRLFRQPAPGEWGDPIRTIVDSCRSVFRPAFTGSPAYKRS